MTPACRQGPAGCVSDRGNPMVHLDLTKPLGERPKVAANGAHSKERRVSDGRPEEMDPKGVPAPRSPLWRRAASSPLCFKRWYLRRNTHTLPGPPLRRGPADGFVRPLSEAKPGARELCRREPFRVRPFSAEVALRESCRCFVARSRPLFQPSFPGPSPLAASVPRPS